MADSDLEVRVAWQRHLGTSTAAERWYETAVTRYREAHRHYHDVRHLRWVLRHVHALADDHDLADLDAVVAATFFHDVVYDPAADDNEAASARLAGVALTELGWPDARVAAVAGMIAGTAQHDHDGATLDECVLYAADLAVLAADPAGYGDYVRNVRREYRHLDDATWAAGRAAVLRGFLDRDTIYAPPLGLESWERRARANLASELAVLSG